MAILSHFHSVIDIPSRKFAVLGFRILLLCMSALQHKLYYVFLHARSPINSFQISVHLGQSLVDRISWTMILCQYFFNQAIYSRNTYSPFQIEYTISIMNGLLCLTNRSLIFKLLQYSSSNSLALISANKVSLTSLISNNPPRSKMPYCLNLYSKVWISLAKSYLDTLK